MPSAFLDEAVPQDKISGEEKRMPVILEPQHYLDWMSGSLQDDAEVFAPYPADQMVAVPDPLPPRSRVR